MTSKIQLPNDQNSINYILVYQVLTLDADRDGPKRTGRAGARSANL